MNRGNLLLILPIFLMGCMTQKSSTLASSDRVSPTYQGPAETTYCATTSTFSDPITVTGTAQFIRREVWGNTSVGGLGSASTSGLHPASANPIRQAEVRVTDAAGNVVQCSTTSDAGAVSLTLPRGTATYTVSINSRGNNSMLYASVLNQPEKTNSILYRRRLRQRAPLTLEL